ncbi:MAG: hypothetical protein ACJ73J_07950 [Actinomycetes bacterium]|jgi:hypothetical protein
MRIAKTRLLTTAGAVLGAVVLAAPLTPAQAAGSWHILGATEVENARLSADAVQGVDSSINTVEYRKGGEGNIEVCGFQRTERISASRQTRWASPSRTGSTLILQFRNIVDGGTAFSRLRQTYAACTPAQFAKPDKTTVSYRYLKKAKQIRLVWALYTTTGKTEVQRAEGLAIKRAGGALIITRSIVKDVPDTTSLKTTVNQKLTGRQFSKYKAAAFS